MKLEFKNISGEKIPTIIVECVQCGSGIEVREREFMLSRPIHCSSCHNERNLSYREYVITYDSIAPQLLAHTISRFDSNRTHFGRHH